MSNSVDPDQTAPSGAVRSGSALFAHVIFSDTLMFKILGHLPHCFACKDPSLIMWLSIGIALSYL